MSAGLGCVLTVGWRATGGMGGANRALSNTFELATGGVVKGADVLRMFD